MGSSLTLALLIACAVGYAFGAIPFGLILTRAAGLGDIRKIGSGNIGATNVLRTGHRGLAAATLVLDALKATAAIYVTGLALPKLIAMPPSDTSANVFLSAVAWVVALGAVLGHMFPVWLGFKGGKGVATYIGALIGAHGPAAILFCLTWLAIAAIWRISSLAALVAALVVLTYVVVTGGPVVALIVAIITALLFWKHATNIHRLRAGEEPRIGAKG